MQSFRMINFGWTLFSLPFRLFFDHKFSCDVRNYGIPMSEWTMNMAKNIPINLSRQPWLLGFLQWKILAVVENQLSIDQNTHAHIKYFRRITILLFIYLYIASHRFDSIWFDSLQISHANIVCGEGKPTPNATCFQMTNNFISSRTKWFDDSF